MPLCVDENIHYRCLKLLYGERSQRYDFARWFQLCPPLYGVWHAYKYVVTTVWRRYYPLMVYFTWGTVPAGNAVPSQLRLRTVEMLFAALLRVPGDLRVRLERAVDAAKADLRRLKRQARTAAAPAEEPTGGVARDPAAVALWGAAAH